LLAPLAVELAVDSPKVVELPLAVTTTVALPVVVATTVAVPLPVAFPPCVVAMPVNPAEYCAHSAAPILMTDAISPEAVHAAWRQPSTRPPMATCLVLLHWQDWSLGAQPAAETADEMHEVAQGSSAVRVWALVRARRGRRVKSWSFMMWIGGRFSRDWLEVEIRLCELEKLPA
jgi:hypothetical protein